MAPASSVPPALPPSVEEAYRRKCIQLKQRTGEVEDANDAARLRLSRLKRQVEKMRLERAFLLEQLAKRTSANVEDSEGSPSPPPTTTIVDPTAPPSQPKEKPLRIKRGHRKASAFPNLEAPSSGNAPTPGSTTFISQNLLVHSPSSDTYSAQHGDDAGRKTNGVHKGAPKKPGSAFDLYCDETRESLKDEIKEGEDVEDELSSRWKDLPNSERDDYQSRADQQMADYEKDKAAYEAKAEEEADAAKEDGHDKAESTESDRADAAAVDEPVPEDQQEDVEMTNYDSDQETQGEKPEE